ncbi:MAG: hypothetical protein KGS61_02195 [Verrucomicrobia bacterium]|nr:hypothetical protein [Verrucomicrobiota bacterium]
MPFGKQLLPALLLGGALLQVSSCASHRPIAASTLAMAAPPTYLSDICAELAKCWPTNRIVPIVCHGHSVPAGYGRTPEVRQFDAYPSLLHRALNQHAQLVRRLATAYHVGLADSLKVFAATIKDA